MMAFNVLIASLGINLYRHTCKALQTSVVSADAPQKACCCVGGTDESVCAMPAHQNKSEDNKDNKKDSNPDDCCEDEVQLFQTDVFSAEFKFKNELPTFVFALPQTISYEIAPVFIKEQVISFSDSSPPVAGKHRVILHQSFLL